MSKVTTYTRNDIKLHISVKELKAIIISSTLEPDCCHNNGKTEFIGNVYCSNKSKILRAQEDFRSSRQEWL